MQPMSLQSVLQAEQGTLQPVLTSFNLSCRVTNPHDFEVDGIHIMGTSGQNVDDIYRYSDEEDRLNVMHNVLEWGHLVPTAPDTLTCYPFQDSDPFIMKEAPHVFFAGNQPEFGARMVTGAMHAV